MTIKINQKDSILVEKAFYEYQASLNILSYLMKQKDINEDYLNQYFKKSEEYFILLESLKEEISNKYKDSLPNKIFSKYSFNFKESEINYEC